MYIHQKRNWPNFSWNQEFISLLLAEIRHKQGKLIGRMEGLGFQLREETGLHHLTLDVIKSSEIEGENLDSEQVRSSIARKLGLNISGLVPSDRNVDGVVEMMLDATQNYQMPINNDRLFGWHHCLFPTGWSGMYKIATGKWRTGENGPMQVVSGAMGRERVHFEAPSSDKIPSEMLQFIFWFNKSNPIDPVIKAAIAHFWFVTIHPFDDGNGRIARALSDLLLARADGTALRFYSMSAQIREERKDYYEILEATQKGSLDITAWLEWFLKCLGRAIDKTASLLEHINTKTKFWDNHQHTELNHRQRLMINKLLDGFNGKLNSSKWAKIAKCSPDTALRDIQDLIEKSVLEKEGPGGRSTSYFLVSSKNSFK